MLDLVHILFYLQAHVADCWKVHAMNVTPYHHCQLYKWSFLKTVWNFTWSKSHSIQQFDFTSMEALLFMEHDDPNVFEAAP